MQHDINNKIAAFVEEHGATLARLPSCVEFGYNELTFCKECDALIAEQEGYAIYEGKQLEGWNGNWIVVGRDVLIGDPIFVDTSVLALPVYTAMHGVGVWKPECIADSLSSFVLSLSAFNTVTVNRTNPVALERNPLPEDEKAALLARIRLLNHLDDYTFWENLLVTDWS